MHVQNSVSGVRQQNLLPLVKYVMLDLCVTDAAFIELTRENEQLKDELTLHGENSLIVL